MKNSGLAISSLVLGIVGIVFTFIPFFGWLALILSIVGLILGNVGKSAIKSSNGELGGAGMATAGIVLSIITLALVIISFAACTSILSTLN